MFKIFVGNLSFKTTAEEIHRLFIRYAEISDIAMPVDTATGKLRGFAIVMIKDEAQALAAIAALNNARLDGRTLIINPARKKGEAPPPKPERRRSGGANIRRGGNRPSGGGGGYQDRGSRPSGGRPSDSRNPGGPGGAGGSGPPGYREGSGGGNRIRTFGSRPRSFGRPGGRSFGGGGGGGGGGQGGSFRDRPDSPGGNPRGPSSGGPGPSNPDRPANPPQP